MSRTFSSPTHWPEWNLLISKYFASNFFYFAHYINNELVGICPVHETSSGKIKILYSGQFHFIPNGCWIFITETEVTRNFYPIALSEMFQGFSLPIINEFNAIYKLKNQQRFNTLLIDLGQETNQIWENDLNSKRRNMIRKAEKSEIQIISDNKNNLSEFYSHYSSINRQNGLQSLPLDFFKDLAGSSNNVSFEILWAVLNNEKIAGIVNIFDKDYAFYWFGISIRKKTNLGQGELLQWEAIKRMKEKGCKYYDLCYIQREDLPHIYKFKKGFSKKEVPIIHHTKKPLIYKAIRKVLPR